MVEFLKLVSPQVSSRSLNKNAQRCIWCNEDDLQCCCPPLKLTANAPENRPKLPQKETSFRLPFLSIFRGILETVSFREGIITNQVITTPIYIYIYIYISIHTQKMGKIVLHFREGSTWLLVVLGSSENLPGLWRQHFGGDSHHQVAQGP